MDMFIRWMSLDKNTLKLQIVLEQMKAKNIKVTFKECFHKAGITFSAEKTERRISV